MSVMNEYEWFKNNRPNLTVQYFVWVQFLNQLKKDQIL